MEITKKQIQAWIDYMEQFEPQSGILWYIRRERLNPEDHIENDLEMMCDSLNSMET